MPDSAAPPPTAQPRRGPPPIPRLLADATSPMPTISAVDELLEILTGEIAALTKSSEGKRAADLSARAALLVWDAFGNQARALEILRDIDHPVAAALRLAVALERNDPTLLGACVA